MSAASRESGHLRLVGRGMKRRPRRRMPAAIDEARMLLDVLHRTRAHDTRFDTALVILQEMATYDEREQLRK